MEKRRGEPIQDQVDEASFKDAVRRLLATPPQPKAASEKPRKKKARAKRKPE